MMLKKKKEWMSRLSAAGFAALFVFGCSPNSTSSNLVTVQVSLARADVAPTAALVSPDVTAGPIDISSVSKVTVTLDKVQLQTSGSEGWQTVQFGTTTPPTLDLMALPGTSTPFSLGDVTLEQGPCQARIFVKDATITLPDGDHTVTKIPSGPQTGLKVDGECTVNTTTKEVTLAFDMGQTVLTIVELPSGEIMLTPVIHIVQQ